MSFMSQLMASMQRCTYCMATCWFLWFWFKACSNHTPDFWTLPIECKCRTMVEWSEFITFTSFWVHWRGSLWINVFNDLHQTRKSCWMWSVTNVKTILLKTRKPFSCRSLSNGIVPIPGANVSGRLRCFCPSTEFKEKNMLEMFQFLHLTIF